jgi:glucosamine-phosphate N-acetyltransferase
MLGKPEVRDLELVDIYQKEGLLECLQELADCSLTKKQLEQIYFDRQHLGIRTLVVVKGDFILATGSLLIEQKFIHNGGKVCHVEDVAVAPEYQGTGIFRILIEEIFRIAQATKCYKTILYCSENLVDLYEKFGFKPWACGMRLDVHE